MAVEVIDRVDVTKINNKSYLHINEISAESGRYRHYDLAAIKRQIDRFPNRDCFHAPSHNKYHGSSIVLSKLQAFQSKTSSQTGRLMQDIVQRDLSTVGDSGQRKFAAIVSAQIGVAVEQPEDIKLPVEAVMKAAEVDMIKERGRVVFMAHLNFEEPGIRNNKAERDSLLEKAREMGKDIVTMTEGSNVEVQTIIDPTPSLESWSQRRNKEYRFALMTLAENISSIDHGSYKWQVINDTPYIQLDGGDTTVSKTAFKAVIEALEDDKAIFVNGTLHYTGGIIEKTPGAIATDKDISIGQKLLYFTEMMRRRMFDGLRPISSRGYTPDFGLAMKTGILGTIGGYEEGDPQNESVYAENRALHAWFNQMDVQIRRPNPRYSDAYLSSDIANEVDGVVYFAPYKEYALQSSSRGLEEMVDNSGSIVLVDFDQGPNYSSYFELKRSNSRQKAIEREPTGNELLDFIYAVYTAFKDRGGELPQEDDHRDRDG